MKSALLLSGLRASGPTALAEALVSRDHTERMLIAMGAPLEAMGTMVMLDPAHWSGALEPLTLAVPADPSAATFVLVAAHLARGSRVVLRDVCVNPTRTGAFDVLRDMGGDVMVEAKGARGGEPVADLHVGARGIATLRAGARVGGELALRCMDEVPALVAAAAGMGAWLPTDEPDKLHAFEDLQELRAKESDRLEALGMMLTRFGVTHRVTRDGLQVVTRAGARPRGGAVVDSFGDHRIAMAAAMLAMVADGETWINDTACVATSFPGFVETMGRLGFMIEQHEE